MEAMGIRHQYPVVAVFRRHSDLGALGPAQNRRPQLIQGLVLTIALGAVFMALQVYSIRMPMLQ